MSRSANQPMILIENVSKYFGAFRALDQVNLSVEAGEVLMIIGPSGSGKSTLLRCINHLETPDTGRIVVDGITLNSNEAHINAVRAEVGMVFQRFELFPHLTVLENICLAQQKVRRRSRRESEQIAWQLLEKVGIPEQAHKHPGQLSGGQQQRVALARALVMEPKVLLMDEPLSNLDAKLREQMRTEIRRIQKRLAITSVYVTHDQVEAMTLSDRIVVMNNGQIEQIGTPTEIYRRPRTRFVADFIGRANFVKGTLLDRRNGHLVLSALGTPLTVPAPCDQTISDTVTLVIRPEMVHLNPNEGQVTGIVRRSTYLGHIVEYDVEVAGQVLALVEHDPRHTTIYAEGDTVWLQFLEDCLYVLPPS